MATKRRSGRLTKPAKYSSVDSSEEEGEEEEVKRAKMKLKEMVQADSDGESDFEREMVEEERAGGKEYDDGESSGEDEKKTARKSRMPASKLFGANRSGSGGELNLSESDSSEDEKEEPVRGRKTVSEHLVSQAPPNSAKFSVFGDMSEEENEEEANKKLVALAGSLEAGREAWREKPMADITNKERKTGTRSARKSKKPFRAELLSECLPSEVGGELNISSLLAQGEGVVGQGDSQEEQQEEQVRTEPITSKDGVQIAIAMPDNVKRKKKKGFDMVGYIRRKLGRARREVQVLLHKSHLVCLLASLRHTDRLLSLPLLQGLALSLVPTRLCHPSSSLSLEQLDSLVSWLQGAVSLAPSPAGHSSRTVLSLLRALETWRARDLEELVLVCVLVCRALGYRTRLVCNLALLPLKPPKELADEGLKTGPGKGVKAEEEEVFNKEETKMPAKATKGKKSRSAKAKGVKEEKVIKPIKPTKGKKVEDVKEEALKTEDHDMTDVKPIKGKKKATAKGVKKEEWIVHPEGVKSEALTDKPAKGKRKGKAEVEVTSLPKTSRKSKSPERRSSRKSVGGSTGKVEQSLPEEELAQSGKKRSSGRISAISAAKQLAKEQDSDDEDFEAGPKKAKEKKTKSPRGPTLKKFSENSDDDFEPQEVKSPARIGEKIRSASGKSSNSAAARDYWAEVFVPSLGRWVTVDLLTSVTTPASNVEAGCSRPLLYTLAVWDGRVREVTLRYSPPAFLTQGKKLRAELDWVEETLAPYRGEQGEVERREQEELDRRAGEAPLPSSIGQFKDHPLYALSRHLLKFEAIYPPQAPSLGFCRGEPVFARECVRTLQGRTSWLKEGRVVVMGEEAYKVVKARPKWDKMSGTVKTDIPLEVFGEWQTELYIPPPAVDGKVPRNEYGNVELFKPWMLPEGTVHLQTAIPKVVLRRTGIDAAPAMVGWDFSDGWNHPVFDGVIVCEENSERLLKAHELYLEEQVKREEEKREKRVSDGLE